VFEGAGMPDLLKEIKKRTEFYIRDNDLSIKGSLKMLLLEYNKEILDLRIMNIYDTKIDPSKGPFYLYMPQWYDDYFYLA
jgi:hypothetical protein